MNKSLESLIHEIVEATNLKGKVRGELFRELTSHIIEEEKELQLQGCGEEKIFEIIHSRWGNTKVISEELFIIHTMSQRFRLQLWIIIFTILISVLLIVTRLFGFFLIPFHP